MAAEEKVETSASAPAPASAGGGGKLVLILTAVNVLATVGMLGVLVVSFQRDKKQPSVEDIAAAPAEHGEKKEGEHGGGGGEHGEKKEGEHGEKKKSGDFGRMITLEQFTVNLSTPGSVSPKFVRVNISIEVPNEDTEAEVTQKMPRVRNAIIDLFNSKRVTDLASSEGRDYLKEEIRSALNGFMVNGKIKGVFFTNFAVSS